MIIRLSQKLATKINSGALSEVPLHEHQIADWSATLFNAAGRRYANPSEVFCRIIEDA